MSHVTTHVLDTTNGRPAPGVVVMLEQAVGEQPILGATTTDDDGRANDIGPDHLDPGTYRLRFNTGGYFADAGSATFFPEVIISFEVGGASHYHVPLLLSPFGYSTYRGS